MIDLQTLLALLIFLLAGTVKGIAGIGLPVTAIALLVLIFEPSLAIALTPLPIVLTNLQQFLRSEGKAEMVQRYHYFALTLAVVVFIVPFITLGTDAINLRLVIGLAIIVFCVLHYFKFHLTITKRNDKPLQVLFGFLCGILGGMTTIWSPPLLMYLLSLKLTKNAFIGATGFLIVCGGIPLLASLAINGVFTVDVTILAILCSIAAMLGFTIGEYIRKYCSEVFFRKLVLVFFFLSGIRMVVQELG